MQRLRRALKTAVLLLSPLAAAGPASSAALIEAAPRPISMPPAGSAAGAPSLAPAAPALSALPAPAIGSAAIPFSAPAAAAAPAPSPAAAADEAAPAAAFLGGWSEGALVSEVDGTPLHFETRGPARASSPALFVGGLTMADSLRPLADARAGRAQAYLRLRGHPPSGWTRGAAVVDADARDMARAVIATAERFGASRVTLVAHSYAGLAFQRMVQLDAEPEVARALAILARGRVDLVTTTSGRNGDPAAWGPDYQAAASALSAATAWMDAVDGQTRALQDAARWNPLLGPVSAVSGGAWEETRAQAVLAAVRPYLDTMRPHLAHAWVSARPGTLEALRRRAAEDSRRPEWSEAILRRSLAVGGLGFAADDAARLRAHGVGVLVVVADGDQLLPWPVRRLLLAALGIPSPADEPPAGAELSDPSGLFVAKIVSGDHYLPVKDPEGLAAALSL